MLRRLRKHELCFLERGVSLQMRICYQCDCQKTKAAGWVLGSPELQAVAFKDGADAEVTAGADDAELWVACIV